MSGDDAGTATVVAAFGRRLLLETPDTRLLPALTRHRRIGAVCGDAVHWREADAHQAVVEAIEPRSTAVWRHDARRGRRAIAANVDVMIIVSAPRPPVTPAVIDRALIAAETMGLEPVLIDNKRDLGPSAAAAEGEFEQLGYPWLSISAHTGDGLDALRARLAGKIGVLTGLSGVGKSSLINALVPDYAVRTAALSNASGGGRHTTTATCMYTLPGDARLIDSPGVRDIRLWPMPQRELARAFREFREHIESCRFRDCRHVEEPGCAVRAAVERGGIPQRRYRSYRDLLEKIADA